MIHTPAKLLPPQLPDTTITLQDLPPTLHPEAAPQDPTLTPTQTAETIQDLPVHLTTHQAQAILPTTQDLQTARLPATVIQDPLTVPQAVHTPDPLTAVQTTTIQDLQTAQAAEAIQAPAAQDQVAVSQEVPTQEEADLQAVDILAAVIQAAEAQEETLPQAEDKFRTQNTQYKSISFRGAFF